MLASKRLNRSRVATHIGLAATIAAGVVLNASQAQASTFALESTTVILDEREGRTAFNVKNTGEKPLLLLSKVEDLDDGNLSGRILVSPPITRIDPGQSQQVNYVLKKGTTLNQEAMLKASFEGVTQSVQSGMAMPVRQEIGLIVQSKAVPQSKTPWQELKLSIEGDELAMVNSGKQVIRLAPQVSLKPGGQKVNLGKAYLMPGETRQFSIDSMPVSVEVTPLSRYGFVQQPISLPVSQ
ncbi:fimbrial protein [Burkholderia ubonensis]|uniref:Fimbrial protein n=1 Tax=Burkholderia ubonensis TaxID=101571 RepID=A0AB73GBE4_9BURK|nr:fimbria/pilus chaperone family protein [Burkholderia ubonensis]KVK89283.1 fimbrial protein [Burkholderia ubonensis]KVL69937.1 fimbrial protein [Burkholderia ubonensis]KVM37301.1 fimbrial protein [Burkholderia ubonensis]KVM37722.1 fimbrial protein [Burkholderia ubonensis]